MIYLFFILLEKMSSTGETIVRRIIISNCNRKPINISTLVRKLGINGQNIRHNTKKIVVKKPVDKSVEIIDDDDMDIVEVEVMEVESTGSGNCCICMGKLNEPYTLRCKHSQFHQECVVQLFKVKCPICRKPHGLNLN